MIVLQAAVFLPGSSGAVKRKAAAPSATKQKAHSKKPHPEELLADKASSLSECHLQPSLSESKTDTDDVSLSRRLTYAEIVKYGQDYREFSKSTLPSSCELCVLV